MPNSTLTGITDFFQSAAQAKKAYSDFQSAGATSSGMSASGNLSSPGILASDIDSIKKARGKKVLMIGVVVLVVIVGGFFLLMRRR